MAEYKLTAERGKRKACLYLEADSDMVAVIDAIDVVLTRAIGDDLWGRGRITLSDPRGNVMHEMEEKEEEQS